ncbi:protein SIEVE ELEMENT OCCLUSION B-like [Carya illinoinensis]|uniref:protein SIEVE ELEMENT OCCLUSION B-like n=1 Tax=Carya illinoinensis TaxID=32201 RepID=UPI001C7183DB|nr:protein SIEVE ELEMENT OCCLUSION B-like [Carya illinoinensis]
MAAAGNVQNLSNMSHDHILSLIKPTHDHHGEEKPDYVDPLLGVVGNILKRTSHVIDNLVRGTKPQEERLEEKVPKYASFPSPTCMLKTLSSEMACKAPADAHTHATTMSILGKLSKYSWDTKAVLTIAAFAMEYGDFLLLVSLNSSHDQLAESVGILKRAPAMLNHLGSKKFKDAIVELDGLIKNTLKVIESIFAFEKLYFKYCSYDTEDVTELSTAMKRIPVDVYWAIITIAACTTQMRYCISGDEVNKQQLSRFHEKITTTLQFLKTQEELCQIEIDSLEARKELRKLSQAPSGIVKLLKALIFRKHAVHEPLIIEGCSKVEIKRVDINDLENKNVLLFISGLDISIDDISILNPIYDEIVKKDEYKILWIPIVDRWTVDLKNKFEKLRLMMKWYTVKYFSPIVGIKFISKDWKYQKRSMQVLQINSQGSVEYLNLVHRIQLWGGKAFPFNKPISIDNWMGDLIVGINRPDQSPLVIDENKYFFLYGGKCKEWVQRFNKKAIDMAKDPIIRNISKIPILESFCVGKDSGWEDDHRILGRFWNKVESLFLIINTTGNLKTVRNHAVTSNEIRKLFSYKNEKGWAVLCKGSSVVLAGHWEIIDRVVDDFNKWKVYVRDRGLEHTITQHHVNIKKEVPQPCCRVDISMGAGHAFPDDLTCPYCNHSMETYKSFMCCHTVDADAMNGGSR